MTPTTDRDGHGFAPQRTGFKPDGRGARPYGRKFVPFSAPTRYGPLKASTASSPPLPLRLLPAGATFAGRVLHPLKTQAFPRHTEKCRLVAGWDLHTRETNAFSRRTEKCGLAGTLPRHNSRSNSSTNSPNWPSAASIVAGCSMSTPASRNKSSGSCEQPPLRNRK